MVSRRPSLRVVAVACLAGIFGCRESRDPVVPRGARDVRLPNAVLRRHAHRAEVVGEILYVFGGFARGQEWEPDRGGRDVFAIELATGSTRECAKLPVPMQAGASCVIDGSLYAIGGGVVARYDAAADAWKVLTPIDALPHSHFGATVVDGAIVVAGGFPFRDSPLLRVDLTTFGVTPLEPPPGVAKGDHLMFCVTIGGKLHLLGGINEADILDRHWILDDGVWREGARLPAPALTKFAAYGIVDGSFVAFDANRLAHRYDTATGCWHPIASWPQLRCFAACVTIDRRLWVIGGLDPEDNTVGGAMSYDPEAEHWTRLP